MIVLVIFVTIVVVVPHSHRRTGKLDFLLLLPQFICSGLLLDRTKGHSVHIYLIYTYILFYFQPPAAVYIQLNRPYKT